MATLMIEAGEHTEGLLQFITNELDDATLDGIEVHRDLVKSDNLATEPLTAAAILVLATPVVVTVGRIIERWLEQKRQLDHLRIVADGFKESEEAGRNLAQLSKAHASVSIAYGLPSVPGRKR